jgi:hypothetical protein
MPTHSSSESVPAEILVAGNSKEQKEHSLNACRQLMEIVIDRWTFGWAWNTSGLMRRKQEVDCL